MIGRRASSSPGRPRQVANLLIPLAPIRQPGLNKTPNSLPCRNKQGLGLNRRQENGNGRDRDQQKDRLTSEGRPLPLPYVPVRMDDEVYDLSYEFMDYPEDLEALGLKHYRQFLEGDNP